MTEVEKMMKLWLTCREFVDEQKIICAETVAQMDNVIENAYDFIEEVCEIVGYSKSED
jgi:hypothetical protein